MPTPFYHLSVADELLRRPELPPRVSYFLNRYPLDFWFGNTAPDLQTVSGQDRQVTHFFDLPVRPGDPGPWERMLLAHPALARPLIGGPEKAAFLAGYLCHLQADWRWVLQIFGPVFGPWTGWGTLEQRLYLHNVLRAYLDAQILPGLPSDLASIAQVEPQRWLPFASDTALRQWRDVLAGQLSPGAAVRTVEVFAARQGVAPEQYYQLLNSKERLDREVFSRVPLQALQDFRRQLLDENITLLSAYLGEV